MAHLLLADWRGCTPAQAGRGDLHAAGRSWVTACMKVAQRVSRTRRAGLARIGSLCGKRATDRVPAVVLITAAGPRKFRWRHEISFRFDRALMRWHRRDVVHEEHTRYAPSIGGQHLCAAVPRRLTAIRAAPQQPGGKRYERGNSQYYQGKARRRPRHDDHVDGWRDPCRTCRPRRPAAGLASAVAGLTQPAGRPRSQLVRAVTTSHNVASAARAGASGSSMSMVRARSA